MWTRYCIPASLEETLDILSAEGGKTRLVAGATDLLLELERGVRPGVGTLVDVTRLPGLDRISLDERGHIHIGPLVTHNDVAASNLLHERAFPLVSACWQVGAPQLRNRATVAGNLVTASPANDTIPPLMALNARVTLASRRGSRQVQLQDFYTGVRKTVLQDDEMLVDIVFPAMDEDHRGTFMKLGLRRSQAISLVSAAVIIGYRDRKVSSAAVTLGAVTPVIIHAAECEACLAGQELTDQVIATAAGLAAAAARPIDDLRGSAAYRKAMVQVLVSRALHQLREDRQREHVPTHPVLLAGGTRSNPDQLAESADYLIPSAKPINLTVNGRHRQFTSGHDKTLLRLLREDAGLTGTKEGCAEGECGACTVFMDGKAVLACLVPAPRADGSEIITIEGLADARRSFTASNQASSELHPVQAAFISEGAVQCGYCTPGFIMSAAMLLEERSAPTRAEITQAITGNLCRCTGYYKIIQAVEIAAGS